MPRTFTIDTSGSPRLHIAARVGAAVLGGYGFAWGINAVTMALLSAAGLEFHDAEFLGNLLGVLAFLVVFLWTFAARRLWRVWAVLTSGGALLAGTGSWVQSWLV
ncbi:MAG: hypothetical protein Q8Q73_14375 [Stagnimonas sp.]|nr:hypothetical protein [Stagnimonas sp.]